MRNHITLRATSWALGLACTLLLSVSCIPAGSESDGPSIATWSRTFGTDSPNDPQFIVAGNDGSVLIGATKDGSGHWLVCADSSGQARWTATAETGVQFGGADRVTDYSPISDGGFYLLGVNAGEPGFANLARIDASGNIMWIRTVGVDSAARAVGTLPNDDAVIACRDNEGSLETIIYASNGSFGSRQSTIQIGFPGTRVEFCEVDDAGRIIVAGRNFNADILVAAVNAQGTFLWQTILPVPTLNQLIFLDLVRYGDSWQLATFRQSDGGADEVVVARGNTIDGAVASESTIVLPNTAFLPSVKPLPNGDVLVTVIDSSSSPDRSFLRRHNSAGILLYETEVIDPDWLDDDNVRAADIHVLGTNEILVSGRILDNIDQLFVAKFTDSGQFIDSCSRSDLSIETGTVIGDGGGSDRGLLAGRAYESGVLENEGPWGLMMGADLEPIWERVWTRSTFEEYFAATPSHNRDGGFVVAGVTSIPDPRSSSSIQSTIFEVDSNGLPVWIATPDFETANLATDVTQTDDGYAVLIMLGTFGGEQGWAVGELNSTGDWIRTRLVDAPDQRPTSIRPYQDGYVVAGDSPGNNDWIARLDGDLNLAWAQRVSNGWDDVVDCIPLGDELVVVTGAPEGMTGLIWLDSDGEVLAAKRYGGPNSENPTAADRTAEGNIVVLAESYSFGGGLGANFWLVEIDPSGTVVFEKSYSTAGADIPRALSSTSNGFHCFAGMTNGVLAGANSEVWAFQVDTNGDVADSCPNGIAQPTAATVTDETTSLTAITNWTTADLLASNEDLNNIFLDGFGDYQQTNQCSGIGEEASALVEITLTGQGAIENQDPAIFCVGTCTVSVPLGSTLNLEAFPDPNFEFGGWGGDYDGTPIEVTGDLVITATFNSLGGSGTSTTLSDSTFEESNWSMETYETSGDNGNFAYQMPGGDPHRVMYSEVFGISSGAISTVLHLYTAETYTPSIEGPISSIDYSEINALLDLPPSGVLAPTDSVEGSVGCMQDGTLYVATTFFDITRASDTTATLTGLVASDFESASGTNPDFSTSGGPITFGYARRTSTAQNFVIFAMQHKMDDWSVTIHQ